MVKRSYRKRYVQRPGIGPRIATEVVADRTSSEPYRVARIGFGSRLKPS